MITLAAANEPHQIGNFIGLLAAVAIVTIGYHAHQRWMKLQSGDQSDHHSPTPPAIALEGVKPQAGGPADTDLTPGGVVALRGDDDLDSFVQEHAEALPTNKIVKSARSRYGASKSTVLRRLKRARGGDS